MPKYQILFPLVATAAISISACQTTGGQSSAAYLPITTLSAFEGGVVGKTLIHSKNKSNTVVIAGEGTWSGKWNGETIAGEWVWEESAYCRTINDGKRDCQQIEMSDKFDSIRMTRNRGKGDSWVMLLSQ